MSTGGADAAEDEEDGEKFKTRPHLEIVTSDTHYVAGFKERNAEGRY
jgi:hypothetical protein